MSGYVGFFVLNFLVNCSNGSTSLLPPYLASLGASQTLVGVYNVLSVLMIVLTVVFFGKQLVGLHRVRAMRWGFVVTAAAYFLSWLFADSLLLLVVFRVLGSVTQVLSATLMLGAVFDLSPADKRAGSLALFSVGGMLTNPVNALAGEAVLATFGGPALFLLGLGFASASFAWSFLLKEPPTVIATTPPPSVFTVFARPDLQSLFLLTICFGVFYSAMVTFLPHHTSEVLGQANLSAFMIPFSLVAIGMRVFFAKRFDRHPPRRFLHLSFFAIVLSQVALLFPTWGTVILAGLLYGLGHSILFPVLNTLVVQTGGEDHKAAYSNAFTVVNLTSAVILTPVLGGIGDLWGFTAIVVVLALVALTGFFLSRQRFPKPATDPPSDHSS